MIYSLNDFRNTVARFKVSLVIHKNLPVSKLFSENYCLLFT